MFRVKNFLFPTPQWIGEGIALLRHVILEQEPRNMEEENWAGCGEFQKNGTEVHDVQLEGLVYGFGGEGKRRFEWQLSTDKYKDGDDWRITPNAPLSLSLFLQTYKSSD